MAIAGFMLKPLAGVSGRGFDLDAAAYIRAVEAADGQILEPVVGRAIHNFVVGCKADGIWSAIKASCLLMGARTLAGALTPLVGSAPTNNGPFVSGDYNRETGLVGDGVGKYLDSNRNVNADPQDSAHQAVYVTNAATGLMAYIGAGGAATGSTQFNYSSGSGGGIGWVNRNSTGFAQNNIGSPTGLLGTSRASSGSYVSRLNGTSTTRTQASQTPHNGNVLVFGRNSNLNVAGLFSDARMAFYSIGESLDLALLDTRVTALYTAIGAAL